MKLMNFIIGPFLLVSLASLVHSCTRNDAPRSDVRAASTGQMPSSSWVYSVAKILSNNNDPDPELLVNLEGLNEDQVLDRLLSRDGFGDTMLAFNLHYFGRDFENLYGYQAPMDAVSYHPDLFNYPNVIAAAKSAVNPSSSVGYFEALFATKGKRFKVLGANDDLMRLRSQKSYIPSLLNFNEVQVACLLLTQSLQLIRGIGTGMPPTDAAKVEDFLAQNPTPIGCQDLEKPGLQIVLDRISSNLEELIMSMESDEPVTFSSITEDQDIFSRSADSFLNSSFWQPIPNTSTNMNRKRAKYLLANFFCDNLEVDPDTIGGEPADHGQHAAEPKCQACHYKLDPMAGLARTWNGYGAKVVDNFLFFADGEFYQGEQVEEYMRRWEVDGRLQVGYFVAPNQPHAAWPEGATEIEDLFANMTKFPEARQCFTQKMVTYFTGAKSFDRHWLKEISEVNEEFRPIRQILKSILTSNTFKEKNKDIEVCYDRPATGEWDDGSCKVEDRIDHLVFEHCAGCHSPTGFKKNPDLSETIQIPSSSGEMVLGFKHLDPSGEQYLYEDSVRIILESLRGETRTRMPLGKPESWPLRGEFIDWFETQL